MYTIMHGEGEPVTFRTHVPLSRLEPEDARRILASLGPILDELRVLAASDRSGAAPAAGGDPDTPAAGSDSAAGSGPEPRSTPPPPPPVTLAG